MTAPVEKPAPAPEPERKRDLKDEAKQTGTEEFVGVEPVEEFKQEPVEEEEKEDTSPGKIVYEKTRGVVK